MPSATPVPDNLMPNSGLRGYQAHTWSTYIHVGKTLIHTRCFTLIISLPPSLLISLHTSLPPPYILLSLLPLCLLFITHWAWAWTWEHSLECGQYTRGHSPDEICLSLAQQASKAKSSSARGGAPPPGFLIYTVSLILAVPS